jgi:hypothetical protein
MVMMSWCWIHKAVMVNWWAASRYLWLGLWLPTFLDEKWTMVDCPDTSKHPAVWHEGLAYGWLTKRLHFHLDILAGFGCSLCLIRPGRDSYSSVKAKRKTRSWRSFPPTQMERAAMLSCHPFNYSVWFLSLSMRFMTLHVLDPKKI